MAGLGRAGLPPSLAHVVDVAVGRNEPEHFSIDQGIVDQTVGLGHQLLSPHGQIALNPPRAGPDDENFARGGFQCGLPLPEKHCYMKC